MLHGTTIKGGTYGYGTVFSLSVSGSEQVLHSFSDRPYDGESPMSRLAPLRGLLYGTTLGGGDSNCGGGTIIGCGTVFQISTSGDEKILLDCGNVGYICLPNAGLIVVRGMLYGVADAYGGDVYATTASGDSQQLYRFKGYPSDGGFPVGPLLAVNGLIYGETNRGGSDKIGALFSITTSGQEKLLNSFQHPDGRNPQGGLIDVNNTPYGTAQYGGGSRCRPSGHGKMLGCGTIFAMSPSGRHTLRHDQLRRRNRQWDRLYVDAVAAASLKRKWWSCRGTAPRVQDA